MRSMVERKVPVPDGSRVVVFCKYGEMLPKARIATPPADADHSD